MKLFLSPHNDDETLFGAFTILRERPRVIVCYDSAAAQRVYGRPEIREDESRQACTILEAETIEQWHMPPGDENFLHSRLSTLMFAGTIEHVWAPNLDCSHPDHRMLAEVAADVFGDKLTTYHTYKDGVRVEGWSVPILGDDWVGRKLQALACYRSQFHTPARQFFLGHQYEFYGEPQ